MKPCGETRSLMWHFEDDGIFTCDTCFYRLHGRELNQRPGWIPPPASGRSGGSGAAGGAAAVATAPGVPVTVSGGGDVGAGIAGGNDSVAGNASILPPCVSSHVIAEANPDAVTNNDVIVQDMGMTGAWKENVNNQGIKEDAETATNLDASNGNGNASIDGASHNDSADVGASSSGRAMRSSEMMDNVNAVVSPQKASRATDDDASGRSRGAKKSRRKEEGHGEGLDETCPSQKRRAQKKKEGKGNKDAKEVQKSRLNKKSKDDVVQVDESRQEQAMDTELAAGERGHKKAREAGTSSGIEELS